MTNCMLVNLTMRIFSCVGVVQCSIERVKIYSDKEIIAKASTMWTFVLIGGRNVIWRMVLARTSWHVMSVCCLGGGDKNSRDKLCMAVKT